MAYKDSENFREDYPGVYSKNGEVYDGNGKRIGYVCGDGDYRINKTGDPNDGQYYNNRR